MSASFKVIGNIAAPPFRVPIYDDKENRIMNSTWVRWFNDIYGRVGGASGAVIYDNAVNAQALASLEPQLFAIRAELEAQLTGVLLSIIEQVQEQTYDPAGLIGDIAPLAPEVYWPPEDLSLSTVLSAVSGVTTLDAVLNAGSTSTHSLSTGALTISTGNIQTNGLSTSYGTTSGTATGGVNVVMGTGASATWLISGTSGGTFRAGIQVLDAGGALRVYEGANHFDFAAGAITFPGTLTAGNSTLGTIGSGAITSSGNVIANGGTVKAAGAANTQVTLANSVNSQVWNFAYNSTSLVAGIYDTTAGAFRIRILDTTGETQFPANVASTTTTTGTVIVTGGVGVSGQVTAGTFKGNGAALTNLPVVAPAYQEFVATAAQVIFNTTISTTAKAAGKSYLQIFVNGIFQQEGATKAYTVTGANQITFNAGVALGLDVVMYSYS